eukprot:CAMPEP_0119426686 /NCGR_PEP_ID=MMETSP1335-20130426/36827_1 /TAXON_ID=259385 /ORGANISM="Chrysoculter rhomboideus, Strain RCC1486" /LENGTH=109 /DNA_ID=CAMNT_0007452291 /DNA_START=371 /DNA_END=696 /DNA_ORIENTATION=-
MLICAQLVKLYSPLLHSDAAHLQVRCEYIPDIHGLAEVKLLCQVHSTGHGIRDDCIEHRGIQHAMHNTLSKARLCCKSRVKVERVVITDEVSEGLDVDSVHVSSRRSNV